MNANLRVAVGRETQPTAAIVDSQTAKATEAPAPRDYDADKKLTGLKRHALVDVDGRFLIIGISTARLHDSVGGTALLKAAKLQCPFLELTFADSACRGPPVAATAAPGRVETAPYGFRLIGSPVVIASAARRSTSPQSARQTFDHGGSGWLRLTLAMTGSAGSINRKPYHTVSG